MPIRTLAAAAFVLAAALPAVAQNVFPATRLEPAVDSEGIGNTAWAGVPDHFGTDAALWLNYEHNTLFTFDDTALDLNTRKDTLVSDRITIDVVVAIALFNWVQVSADVPVVLAQAGDQPLTAFGLGDIGLAAKLRLLRQADDAPLDVAVLLPFTGPSSALLRADYFGEDAFAFTPTVAASREFGRVRLAANLGHRFRDTVDVPGVSIGAEVIYKAGAAYRFDVAEVGVNLAGAAATDNFFRGTQNAIAAEASAPGRNPLEVMLEAKSKPFGGLPIELFFGGGIGVIAGYGVPDQRIFLGVRYVDRPAFDHDGDGILVPQDKCPKQAENYNGWQDDDGCVDPGDDDHDGLPNDKDKCPQVAEDKDGVDDADGCPEDDDKDGVDDDIDQCKKTPEDRDGFEDDDGCPDGDNDKDGIVDDKDKCPSEPEDKDGFEDDDGCPEADNDKDGLNDGDDKCPIEPGKKSNGGCPDRDRDSDGIIDRVDNCPDEPGPAENGGCAKKQLVVITDQRLEIKDRVYFDTDKDTIQAKSFPLLDNVAEVLKAHPELKKLRVEGHTDNVGDAPHNMDLSDRRAKSVRRYLIEKGGVDEARLEGVGYGTERPIATNDTVDGKAQNRRVEFVIVESGDTP